MALSFRQLFSVLTLAFCGLLAASALSAWTGPTQTAPGGNVAAPINVGTTDQVKDAGLSVNALTVFGSQYTTDKLYVGSRLSVGKGTSTPLVALDVNGSIKIGNGNELCQAISEGAQRYSTTTKAIEYCNGTKWQVLLTTTSSNPDSGTQYAPAPTVTTYNAPGTYTWTNPRSGSMAIIECWGGGGGGGSVQGPSAHPQGGYTCGPYTDSTGSHPATCTKIANGNIAPGVGGGGGGGGYSTKILPLNGLPSTVAVTVGTYGTGGSPTTQGCSSGKAGTAGGVSSFGTYVVANGGKGGAVGACSTFQEGTPLVSGNGGVGGTGDQSGGAGGKNNDGISTTGCGSGGGASGLGAPPKGGISACRLSSPLNDAIQFGFGGDGFDFGANSGNGSWGDGARIPGGGGAGGVPSVVVEESGQYWTYDYAGQNGQGGAPGMCLITIQ